MELLPEHSHTFHFFNIQKLFCKQFVICSSKCPKLDILDDGKDTFSYFNLQLVEGGVSYKCTIKAWESSYINQRSSGPLKINTTLFQYKFL